jgi:hypothetical protein
MAGLKERLTDRRAKKRAAREERLKRSATDPRTGPVEQRHRVDYDIYERRGVGREFGPRDYGP